MTETRLDVPVLVVTRWTRYGQDRAYVSLDGRQLGYRDLRSGDTISEAEEDRSSVTDATDDLWSRARASRYEPRHASPPTAAPTARLLPDRDLADNKPGEAVRSKARAVRDEAPVANRVARVLGVKTEERNWRIGANAEEAVAKRLARLGPEWRTLHAVPIGDNGSDIDHVVIGPGGVFTINAKNHPDASLWARGDTVKINGRNQPYVHKSRFEARRAAKLLSAAALIDVEVKALIAVMGVEKGFTVVEQPRDGLVTLVTRKRVADHLRGLPVVLGAPSIERIHAVARHLATWQPMTVAWSDTYGAAGSDR